jgi:hypothetical protein
VLVQWLCSTTTHASAVPRLLGKSPLARRDVSPRQVELCMSDAPHVDRWGPERHLRPKMSAVERRLKKICSIGSR